MHNTYFNTFILHGYPWLADFMKTAIVPIIKNITGDTSDKNLLQTDCTCYRGIKAI